MTRLSAAWLAAIVLVAAVLARPAAAQNREHQQLAADIRMLQEQTSQLQRMLGVLGEQLKTVTTRLDEQADLTRRTFADQKLLIDELADGIRILREKLDETNVRITSLSQEVEALRTTIPPAPLVPTDPDAAAQQPGEPGTPAPADPAAPSAAAPAPATQPGVPPQRLYDQAYADYTAGQWDLAIQGFETYIRSFPRSDLADDAQFYIGQTYYADGRFVEAVRAYDQLIEGYPSSNYLPDSYYKRGLALDRLGETDRARESYEHVLENYPDTPAAILAKQVLDRSNRQPR